MTFIAQVTQSEFFVPTVIVLTLGLGILAGMLIMKKKGMTIDTEGMKDRLEKIFTQPTTSQGSEVKDYVKMRGTSNTPQLVGMAEKAKEHDINILQKDDKGNLEEGKRIQGVTYTIVEGSGKLGIRAKSFLNTLAPGNTFTETYDVPNHLVVPGDDYIWFKPKAHFVKFNGVKRHLGKDAMSRVWESSFSKLHEDYLESLQDLPEIYTSLNTNIAGEVKKMNKKSENIKEYQETKEKSEKRRAMKD